LTFIFSPLLLVVAHAARETAKSVIKIHVATFFMVLLPFSRQHGVRNPPLYIAHIETIAGSSAIASRGFLKQKDELKIIYKIGGLSCFNGLMKKMCAAIFCCRKDGRTKNPPDLIMP
jgi:hypothetical protein